MKNGKKLLALIFTLTLMLCSVTLLPAEKANAAAKKTVYVVSSMKVKKGSKTLKVKVSYDKKGFLKKISESGKTQTFSYDKKHQIKKFVDNVTTGDHKGKSTRTYTWETGRLTKMVGKRGEDKSTSKYTYNDAGQIVSCEMIDEWDDGSSTQSLTYSYKNGHLVKTVLISKEGDDTHESIVTRTLDKKKNITKSKFLLDGSDKLGFGYKAKITYKKGRPSKMATSFLHGMMPGTAKQTVTITYKKIKVDKFFKDKIDAQQWQLINCSSDYAIQGDTGLEEFAW